MSVTLQMSGSEGQFPLGGKWSQQHSFRSYQADFRRQRCSARSVIRALGLNLDRRVIPRQGSVSRSGRQAVNWAPTVQVELTTYFRSYLREYAVSPQKLSLYLRPISARASCHPLCSAGNLDSSSPPFVANTPHHGIQ
jgi:hypothetical protein